LEGPATGGGVLVLEVVGLLLEVVGMVCRRRIVNNTSRRPRKTLTLAEGIIATAGMILMFPLRGESQ
jgi:hypothetical protein